MNEKIYEALPVTVKNLPIEEAKKMGAMALFGEKYGNVVRVVDAGGWSTEFCGGTHVTNTAQIGCFKILSESVWPPVSAVSRLPPPSVCSTCWMTAPRRWPRRRLP